AAGRRAPRTPCAALRTPRARGPKGCAAARPRRSAPPAAASRRSSARDRSAPSTPAPGSPGPSAPAPRPPPAAPRRPIPGPDAGTARTGRSPPLPPPAPPWRRAAARVRRQRALGPRQPALPAAPPSPLPGRPRAAGPPVPLLLGADASARTSAGPRTTCEGVSLGKRPGGGRRGGKGDGRCVRRRRGQPRGPEGPGLERAGRRCGQALRAGTWLRDGSRVRLIWSTAASAAAMPGPSPSATNVGTSGRSPSKAVAPRAAGSTVRQRKNASCGTRSAGRATSTGTGGMWRFYTEDSPGLKVSPLPSLRQILSCAGPAATVQSLSQKEEAEKLGDAWG
uniref:Uncharacterized protein n=1 Tax=Phasianus colchicus TaxID=9054 RepID=A0A669P7D7_PHACC